VIRGVIGNAVANGTFFVHANGYDPNQFALFLDYALTVPVDGHLAGLSSLSDLAIDPSDASRVTSSTYSFGPLDVGKSLHILAGSGFTACTPYVVSVDGSGAAKLSLAVGTPGSSHGSSQAFGTVAKPAAVTFRVKSRGMAQEDSGVRWFETNRPTRVLARLTTQEPASVVLTCSTDNQPPDVVSTVTHSVPAGAIQLRDKVNAGVRGEAVFVTLSGSTVRPTRVTSVAVEAAEGSIRGNE